jgi:hypothetical protein
MPFATVYQTLLVVVADVPIASLSPVVHDDPMPQQSGAVPAAAAGDPARTTAPTSPTISTGQLRPAPVM